MTLRLASGSLSFEMWLPETLGNLNDCSPAECRQHGLFLGLLSHTACNFPQQMLHVPWIFYFWGITLNLWLHFSSFTDWVLRYSLCGLLDLPSKSAWHLPWPHNSCILYAGNILILWVMPVSAVRRSSRQGPVARPVKPLLHSEVTDHWEMDFMESIFSEVLL